MDRDPRVRVVRATAVRVPALRARPDPSAVRDPAVRDPAVSVDRVLVAHPGDPVVDPVVREAAPVVRVADRARAVAVAPRVAVDVVGVVARTTSSRA